MLKRLRVIGDVHGNAKKYVQLVGDAPSSVQIGDFGIGFARMPCVGPTHLFIRGNHDCLSLCKHHPGWIPDGHTEQGMMFIGGANSIDKKHRTEGVDWWPDEELSDEEFERLIKVYADYKPRLMFSHDMPDCMVGRFFNNITPESSRTRQYLERMWRIHQPEVWCFGHWHRTAAIESDGTTFICVGANETVDLEIN